MEKKTFGRKSGRPRWQFSDVPDLSTMARIVMRVVLANSRWFYGQLSSWVL